MNKLLLFLIILTLTVPITAQTEEPETEPHPLFQALALIPDDPKITTTLLGYSDFEAAETARPAAGKYNTWAEYEAAKDSLEAGLWLNSLPASGLNMVGLNPLQYGAQIPQMMGIELFDIDYAVSFAGPPEEGLVLIGDFNFDTINEARLARGFELSEIEGHEAWCSPDGCDEGEWQNLRESNRADFFGGNFGRKQPVVLLDSSILFSSPSLETVETVLATYEETQPSLLESPSYMAAAEAITQEGLLRQVTFLPVQMWEDYHRLEPEIAAQISESAEPLPQYELTFLADVATETDQQATIGLVYDSIEDAQTAAEVIMTRLETAPSVENGELWMDSLQDVTLSIPEPYESENGKTVLLLVFHYPPAPDTVNDAGLLTQTGITYSWLLRSFFGRNLLWLGTELE